MAKRASNFTTGETQWLLHFVKKYKNIIECKKSDVDTNFRKKGIWQQIEREFNTESSTIHRSAIVLRNKWENLKKKAKNKAAEEKQGVTTTGGGPPAPPAEFIPEEQQTANILGEECVSGARFDFDCDSGKKTHTLVCVFHKETCNFGFAICSE